MQKWLSSNPISLIKEVNRSGVLLNGLCQEGQQVLKGKYLIDAAKCIRLLPCLLTDSRMKLFSLKLEGHF